MKNIVKENLPEFNGRDAFGGALRFWEEHDLSLISKWKIEFGDLFPVQLDFFASDAFGVLYGLDKSQLVSIFWTETGQLEALDLTEEEFYQIIADDPDGTISLSLYNQAVSAMGRPDHMQDFAFKVETALGGKLSVDNLYICDRIEHLRTLGKIARQINDVEIGAKLDV